MNDDGLTALYTNVTPVCHQLRVVRVGLARAYMAHGIFSCAALMKWLTSESARHIEFIDLNELDHMIEQIMRHASKYMYHMQLVAVTVVHIYQIIPYYHM